MKRMYNQPKTEVMSVQTERMMEGQVVSPGVNHTPTSNTEID